MSASDLSLLSNSELRGNWDPAVPKVNTIDVTS